MDMSTEPIFLGTVEHPDDGLRFEDGRCVYYPELDVNGIHAALLDPAANYGKPAGTDLEGGQLLAAVSESGRVLAVGKVVGVETDGDTVVYTVQQRPDPHGTAVSYYPLDDEA
jgi:hypothetical protein